ncbi:MAG: HIT family hydrolase [Ignavibacteria bacterium GWA2_55_11]|nr:MAG: HIT family hydrolase [Ignavibacteria bacterium GWA2_55_11]OGU45766.1 MAG: HIT family hydrolase [Ignavibacteria bacterium GWC2_56_12]OGU67848.1 MAG: HIT family hydrolase [Ignavibacteria bacterium RIFCSPHIGHO2_02_FULL_56_12]OGU69527.1 MAG: HIT family hydrolase [Ignavibacteria bacterium RIFCSPLOWO2_02_FULL_55_14]OGU71278.1 MAG: HIT family hydrolase [Ignavibacteria bacterium RIFCSPLOWO2_12_FULL_56_21]HAV23630.1 HIT family hydrolase [Bacteroidota bacterium]
MNRLFSPWRSEYISSFRLETKDGSCLFCSVAKSKKDAENLVVYRGKTCFAIMNLYPYNSGHMMVVPYRHTSNLSDLSAKENAEALSLTAKMIGIIQEVMKPQGFNMGANLGRAAGAGIDQHLHFHLVPRWNGDTNFMPTLADTKLVSEDIGRTYKKLKRALNR